MHHDDLHGLRRSRDPNTPEPWSEDPGWSKFDVFFALILGVFTVALLAVILLV